jgi:hypothetical protein
MDYRGEAIGRLPGGDGGAKMAVLMEEGRPIPPFLRPSLRQNTPYRSFREGRTR